MQYGTSRSRVLRAPPAKLSRMTRKSCSDTCVNCGPMLVPRCGRRVTAFVQLIESRARPGEGQ